jgi:integrase
MSRTIRDSKLDTREARNRLSARPKPYWRSLRPGELHLGYVRRQKGKAGHWAIRRYTGRKDAGSPYVVESIPGAADDFEDADGGTILSYAQAQDVALARKGKRGPLTVRQAIESYVLYLRAEKRTADSAEQNAEAFILPVLGDTKVADLTTATLTKWRDDLATSPVRLHTAKGLSQNSREATTEDQRRARRATVNRIMTTLKAALNRAFEHGQVDDDLAWRRLKRFGKVDAQRPGHFTIEEAMRLINAADRDSGFRDLLKAALATGARYGELCALRVRDFENNKVAIRRSKSGKARDVVLSKEGVTLFKQLTIGRGKDEVMLRNFNQADLTWRKDHQALHMKRACIAANVPVVGFNSLRHTWATIAVENDMPLQLVAANLGHRDTKMVEKHYGHIRESYKDKAIRATAPEFGLMESDPTVVPIRVKRG